MGRALSGRPRPALIFLIGPRGSGKTTVCRLLARRLGYLALDADDVLEQRAGCSIRDIFAAEGEEGFRRREARILAELAAGAGCVVATGGGAILRPENREHLRRGWVVWLRADPDTLWGRLQTDAATAQRRPALTGLSGRDEVVAVLQAREPLYRLAADFIVDTAQRDPEDIVDALVSAWQALPHPPSAQPS